MKKFTKEEINAAKRTRNLIINNKKIHNLIPTFMAGEICMWDELQNKKEKKDEGKATLKISDIIPRLSRLRESYLSEFCNTKIGDLKPMFQNYKSIQERETLNFIEYCVERISKNEI